MPDTKTEPDPSRLCERCKHPWKLHYHDGPMCFDGAAFPCCECIGFVEPGQSIPPPRTIGEILRDGFREAANIFVRYFDEQRQAQSRASDARAKRRATKRKSKRAPAAGRKRS